MQLTLCGGLQMSVISASASAHCTVFEHQLLYSVYIYIHTRIRVDAVKILIYIV